MNKLIELFAEMQRFILGGMTVIPFMVNAAGIPTLREVTVRPNSRELIGVANSASEGTVLSNNWMRVQFIARVNYLRLCRA